MRNHLYHIWASFDENPARRTKSQCTNVIYVLLKLYFPLANLISNCIRRFFIFVDRKL